MRSINSARTLGVGIGKSYPDIRISNALLRQVIDAQILPLIKLPKSREERVAEEVGGLFGILVVLSLIGLYTSFDIAMPNFLLPESLNSWLWLVGIAAALVVVFAILAGGGWRRALRDASVKRGTETNALREAAFNGALEALDRRREHAGVPLRRNLALGTEAPRPIPAGVTPREAEELVAQWMRHLGESAAAVTQYQGDGGVDVAGSRYVAQVKHFSGRVGVAPVREIVGTATTDGRRALFFTSMGYSHGAIEFANRSRVALFVYSAERAELRAMNAWARDLIEHGLS